MIAGRRFQFCDLKPAVVDIFEGNLAVFIGIVGAQVVQFAGFGGVGRIPDLKLCPFDGIAGDAVNLFDRQGSKISLTEAGELLLKHSEKILDDYKQLEYEMHLLHDEYIGELKLGASTTIAQYVLPPLLANFITKFPQINLSLINGNSRGVEVALQEHRIDLGLVEGIFRLPNLKYTAFLQDELVAVVHTRSKLAVADEILPEELPNIPLVLRERGSGTLDVFERALLQYNLKLSSLNVLMYLGSTESIKLFLEHTDCMGIVSIRSVHKELVVGTLKVVEIKGMPMQREFNFVQLQGQEGGLSQVFMRFAGHHSKSL